MPGHDWSKITRGHVLRAVRRYEGDPGSYLGAKSTFLVVDGKRYPAKAIRGIAYEICFGKPISCDDTTGGRETQGFLEGLRALLARCAAEGAGIVLLPACTFLYEAQMALDEGIRPYQEMCRAIPWVVSGAPGVTDDGQSLEKIVVLRQGDVVERFGAEKLLAMQMAGLTVYAASSSTICQLKENRFEPSSVIPPVPGAPVLALDSGHHQYGGRYMRSLRCVSRTLAARHALPNLVVLAYWKYLNGATSSPWLCGNSPCSCRTLNPTPAPTGDDGQDILSLITLG